MLVAGCAVVSSLFCLLIGVTLTATTQHEDFVLQVKSQCYYRNGTQNIWYKQRYFYNQEEDLYFDSDEGRFKPKTEFGRLQADIWNSQEDILARARTAAERTCKHNYEIYKPLAIDRKAEPRVKISYTPPAHEENENLLTCYVEGFFPPMIKVTWLRNGEEEPERVTSSETLYNGDWTYQIHVFLETPMQLGDTFTCHVEHSSLTAPMEVQWKFETSDSAWHKKLTGIVGFVLGSVFFIVGLLVFLHNKKGFEFLAVRQENPMS